MTDEQEIQYHPFTQPEVLLRVSWLMAGAIVTLLSSLAAPAQANQVDASLNPHWVEKSFRPSGLALTDPEVARTLSPGVVRLPANAIRPGVSVAPLQIPQSQPIRGQAFSVQPLQTQSARTGENPPARDGSPSEGSSQEKEPAPTVRIGNRQVVLPQAQPQVVSPEPESDSRSGTRRLTQTFVVPGTGPGLPTANPQANGQTPSNLISSQTEVRPDGRGRRTTQTFVVPGTGPSPNTASSPAIANPEGASTNANASDRANLSSTVATGPTTNANDSLVPGIPNRPGSSPNLKPSTEPTEADRLLALGVDQLFVGDFEAALRTFNEILRRNPNDTKAAYLRGLTRYQMGDKQGTIADYRRLADRHRRMGNQEAYEQINRQILLIQQQIQQEAQQQRSQPRPTP